MNEKLRYKILYVEDNFDIREEFAFFLDLYVQKLITAKNGEDGLSKFIENEPDIVITDIQMPVMNGIEMINKIRDINPETPIIITTAFNDSVYLANAIELNVSKYLMKPIDLKKLKKTIVEIYEPIELKKQLNEKNRQLEQFNRNLEELVKEKTVEINKNLALLESYQLAVDESSIVSKSDLEGNITYVNENFCKITGFTKDELIGKSHNILRHPDTNEEIFSNLWETIKSKKVWKGIIRSRGKFNEYWADTSIIPLLDENGDILEYIAIRHDVTRMIQQQNRLNTVANTDQMTHLGSRYKLNYDIQNSIQPRLAIINIDKFSQINDFYGHKLGDLVIKELANLIKSFIEDKECNSYHLQGDEFVILSQNIKEDEFIGNIKCLIEHIHKMPINIENENMDFNITVAISFEEKTNLLTTADMALKIARKHHKAFIIYNESMSLNDEYKNNMKWTKKIKDAIENDDFVPVFQGIVNNTNKQVEKYESLVRLKDNDKLISPHAFLHIAKQTKYYTQITKLMIKKTFEIFKDKEVEFSINLTIEDILNDEIQAYIFQMLKRYEIGSKVVFEVVESESIKNFEIVRRFIEAVKMLKCKIAIDDFGTGYSNFEYLMKLNVDYIKIDGSMIKNIDVDEDAQLVVSTIVNFANSLGIKTIAEYVETEEIFDLVKELGIEYSQGYYFSKPEEEKKLKIQK